jgi:hypothetical protein
MPTGRGAHRAFGLTVLDCVASKPFHIEQEGFTLKGPRAFVSHADMCSTALVTQWGGPPLT